MKKRAATAAAALLLPVAANAQAYRCAVPDGVAPPRPELPTAQEPRRALPIGGYTLAVTWGPEFCQSRQRDASARFECGSRNRFGFTLHGLWPDGVGKVWPQYCRATPLLPVATLARNMCATPSAQLLQHEWAKHGTCTGDTPDRYFAKSTGLYGRLRFPDMAALSRRRGVTAGQVATAIGRANPGMTADMMRVTANKHGWLDEVWFCLDTALRYTRCKPDSGGVAPTTPIKIWRARR